MGCTSKLVCAGTSIRRKTQSDSVWDHPSSGCCVAALAIHEVYPCGEIFFLTSWWLLSPPRERARGLVWLSPECATVTVEDDAEYWWLVKNLWSIGWEGWEGCVLVSSHCDLNCMKSRESLHLKLLEKHNFQLFSLFPVTMKLKATNLRMFSLLTIKQMVTRFLFSSSIKQHEIFNKLSKQLRVL